MKLAASKAFWSMGKADIVEACRGMGYAVPESSSLYEVLSTAVAAALGCDEERTLRVPSQRLAETEPCNSFTEVMGQIDMAREVLEFHDRELASQEKQAAISRLAAHADFRKDFRGAMSDFRLAQENKAKTKGALPTQFGQKDAQKYIPEGCSIWRGCSNGSWQGECPPFRRVYESWKRTTEPMAMRLTIRRLWEQDLEKNGLERSDCPWTNMWDEAPCLPE